MACPTPKPSTYSSFRVRDSHVLGKSLFGPARLGRAGWPSLVGAVIASITSIVLPSLDYKQMFAITGKKRGPHEAPHP